METNKNPGNYMYGDNETPITVHSVTIGGTVTNLQLLMKCYNYV